jgi:hypothetical protein
MVTDQQKPDTEDERFHGPTAEATSMQEWVAQALERMQPILDGKIVVGIMAGDWRQEAGQDILERVEWLANHFKVMPEPCHVDHSEIFNAGGVAALNMLEAKLRQLEL